MAELSKVTRTDEAIIVQRDRTNSRWFEEYTIETVLLELSYRGTLLHDAQLIRSQKLESSGKLISTEQALLEASRKALGNIVYITSLQKKNEAFRESLFGAQNG